MWWHWGERFISPWLSKTEVLLHSLRSQSCSKVCMSASLCPHSSHWFQQDSAWVLGQPFGSSLPYSVSPKLRHISHLKRTQDNTTNPWTERPIWKLELWSQTQILHLSAWHATPWPWASFSSHFWSSKRIFLNKITFFIVTPTHEHSRLKTERHSLWWIEKYLCYCLPIWCIPLCVFVYDRLLLWSQSKRGC